MLVDFSATFDLVLVLDFEDVFPIRAIVAQCGEYLTEEPRLDILASLSFFLQP